ncbi:MAG: hypothetical protein NC241_00345 [Bacteroides sp.]|nr:hypothetical protein [Bacteroides sp.]MCM1457699.1 hypothetical protein [Lachnoclostridium sp.]
MRKLLLTASALMACSAAFAQGYITAAPEGGFDLNSGKDYVVLYAPESVITAMGSKMISNNNLDPNSVDNTLEYWVTDWDKKDLTLYNVPEEGVMNSFGNDEHINATPLYAWGTGVFMSKAKAYDLSKVTDEHHIHIGIRDFGSTPSKYQLSIGSQSTIKNNGFQVQVNLGVGAAQGDFVGIGSLPNANDGKWYYIDLPIKDLIDENVDFGFVYDFSKPITDGVFTFTFKDPTCSTATKSGPAPGESVYSYDITKLGSAVSFDHVFFYVPQTQGIEDITEADDQTIEAIYDLSGRRVNEMTKGFYIVKTAAGAKKVLK